MASEGQDADRLHPEKILSLYKEMLRIRLFENSLIPKILDKTIKTPCHLCVGQEAVAVGVCNALDKQDHVWGNHRSHGHYLAKGGDMNRLCAEIYGKETGCSKGRGGSMHIIDMEAGFMGATPIVAQTVALAVGDALAAKMQGDKRIVVSFFGDGAMGEGIVYESLNLAALWKLPILFVCENNGYATHMPLKKHFPIDDLYLAPLAEWCIHIDGNDVMEVYEATQEAKCHLPAFIEAKTYRLCGHVGPDDNILGKHTDVRPRERVEAWRERDPLRFAQPTDEIIAEVEAAHRFAQESPWPDPKDLEKYVYAK